MRSKGEPAMGIQGDLAVAATDSTEPTRRDFLYIATGSFAAVGAAASVWPLVDQMNPDASVRALASIEVDISSLTEGGSITVKWRGNPVFIRYRTQTEIDEARNVDLNDLVDNLARNNNVDAAAPATDENRATNEKYLVMLGVCTHLGCVPLGEAGDFNGWYCPCHASHYDTSGRIRKGPAPENLPVPEYTFVTDTTLKIG